MSGFTIIDKPAGVTSFTLLSSLGHKLGPATKNGHAGTLDSFASGVLVCLFGRYTRLSDYFMGALKGYEADVLFGEETTTLDPEGPVIATGPLPSREAVEAVLPAFTGTVMQSPPAYSAVHIGGQRAYERVRKGQDVQPLARPVNVDSIELLSYVDGVARIRVACGKGTYIRSLARDIALACGTRGRLSALRRTFSGPFSIDAAIQPGDFSPASLRALTAADAAGLGLGIARIEGDEAKAFRNGLPLFRLATFGSLGGGSPTVVFDAGGSLLGIVVRGDAGWRYAFVLGGAA
ncbi:MAG: tRNA pseudouridine(55) synthase TruB [Spirochaetae bacterium HGW-Spirochaetae-7]|nr:MAG: tRNA pseudouridine(55) synthase TruB [Spirochaetae bacterium HGW-Spirochaetae-7]